MERIGAMMNDKANPLPDGVTRRDFVGNTLLGAGAGLLMMTAPGCTSPPPPKPKRQDVWAPKNIGKDWTGPGGLGDYATSNGNTHAAVNSAHAVAHGGYSALPKNAIDTGETSDVVAIEIGRAPVCTPVTNAHL